ncbi:hypothetical protein PV392_06635 [Streptomyces sp. ME03-5709C]|nr:hypothetical protein [Streptomyces sp. ME03-5709C]
MRPNGTLDSASPRVPTKVLLAVPRMPAVRQVSSTASSAAGISTSA